MVEVEQLYWAQYRWRTARLIKYEPINGGPIGFVASAVTSGDPATVTLQGVATGFTGLTPGAYYYENGDGTLTTANTGHVAGYALTSSTLSIGKQP